MGFEPLFRFIRNDSCTCIYFRFDQCILFLDFSFFVFFGIFKVFFHIDQHPSIIDSLSSSFPQISYDTYNSSHPSTFSFFVSSPATSVFVSSPGFVRTHVFDAINVFTSARPPKPTRPGNLPRPRPPRTNG